MFLNHYTTHVMTSKLLRKVGAGECFDQPGDPGEIAGTTRGKNTAKKTRKGPNEEENGGHGTKGRREKREERIGNNTGDIQQVSS